MTVKSSISLTDEQHAFARTLVEEGRYSSLSAVLQQGVDLLRRRVETEEAETAALRELLSRAPFVMVGEGRPSTFSFLFFGRYRKKLVDGRPSPTMTGRSGWSCPRLCGAGRRSFVK